MRKLLTLIAVARNMRYHKRCMCTTCPTSVQTDCYAYPPTCSDTTDTWQYAENCYFSENLQSRSV